MKTYKYEAVIDDVSSKVSSVLLDCHIRFTKDNIAIYLNPQEAINIAGKLLSAASGNLRIDSDD